MRRRILLILAFLVVLIAVFLMATDSPRVWPYRHAAQYLLLDRLGLVRPPDSSQRGTMQGVVRSSLGQPIAGARVLLPAVDGTTFSAESDAQGRYVLPDVPAGSYLPVAGAPGFADTTMRTLLGIGVAAGQTTPLDITLSPRPLSRVSSPTDVRLSEPEAWQIEKPLPSSAIRRQISFQADSRSNQLTFLYTPNDGATTPLPTLLAVYPGSADTWESVSLPLAQAGYAVIAVGPAYALDLESDVDDLQRMVDLARSGALPRADGSRIGVLAGSYSGLHVLRLAVRAPDVLDSALLLGPPTDLFELRRLFEEGSFFPPFGLDQALIALGLPDRMPERYWRYSARYHARDLNIPLMLIHSKEDEVVPFTQSQLLADELQRLGKPHELHILEGMGHYLLATERTPAIDDLFNTTLDFFDRTLRQPGATDR
ncbi:MAG TPA: carboxypeptidase regulatory-like domain-containing protein [Herpetosiphonaceae bacterium]